MLSLRKRSGWLRKLCGSLGIPKETGSLTIEGLSALPLLCKKRYADNKKLEWFLKSHWWIFVRFTSKDRNQIIKLMNQDWKRRHPSPGLFRGAQRSRARSIQPRMPKYNRKYWISIGINQYTNMPPLNCAENDAVALSVFAKKLGFHTSTSLNPNRGEIVKLIKGHLANTILENDLLVLTFHGHAVTKTIRKSRFGFIVPIEGCEGNLATLIGIKDLFNWIQYIQCRHVLLILDCCFSGIAAVRGGPLWTTNYTPGTVNVHLKQNCRIVINAGTGEQATLDGGWEGNSVLVGSILSYPRYEQTAGSVTGLFSYISQVVSSHCPQTPTIGKLVGDMGGDMFLAL